MPKTAASPVISPNKQNLSQEDWQKIWLDKYSRELSRRQLPEKEVQIHYSVLRKYLAEHPGNPRTIPLDKLKKFVSKPKTDIRQPLILFYTSVALSEGHVEALNSLKVSNGPAFSKTNTAHSKNRGRSGNALKKSRATRKASLKK